ncbi:MAG: DHH family phosphoesterase [Eubacterium sp.]|nr:DHH family phosphoesterase [Eubacterium sp.]
MSNERKLKGKIKYLIIVPIILAFILMGICIYVFGVYAKQTIIALIALSIYIIIVVIAYVRLMPVINSTMVEYALEQGKIQNELLREMAVPYVILDTDGHVMWANSKFYETIGVTDKKHIKKPIDAYFPQLTPSVYENNERVEMDIEYGEKIFNAYIRRMDLTNVFLEDKEEHKNDEVVIAVYFFDITELRRLKKENEEQKLVAGLVYIDNYDEVMDSLEDVKHSILTALVDRKINMYLSNADAIVRHIENDKYFCVFRQKYMQMLRDDKFALLDEVKSINVGNEIAMTLSMGLGLGSDNFIEDYEYAKVAIGLALGRGGDQVAVKAGDQVTYYGGKSAGTEKTTRVKARVKAQAFEELLVGKEKVIIMAHKRPDSDAFGSAVGVYRLVSALGKKAYIVLNEVTDAIKPLVATFNNSNYSDMLINSDQAMSMVDSQTMLVVTDVNRPSMTECEELINLVSTVVVFDHHRQTSEAISKATLSYIEPFASSACEMIAEMYEYMSVTPKLRQQEADAMYSGILIDTDNFLVKTGVRTFEAASFLRKSGADVTRVRKMFRSSMLEMKERAQGISNAEIFMNSFALSYVVPDPDSVDTPTVPVAKVANELLNVDNVKASFVVTEAENGILYVSARSIGDINVQVIMERWSGGGHANVAGAQLEGKTKEEFFDELKVVLKEMYESGEL